MCIKREQLLKAECHHRDSACTRRLVVCFLRTTPRPATISASPPVPHPDTAPTHPTLRAAHDAGTLPKLLPVRRFVANTDFAGGHNFYSSGNIVCGNPRVVKSLLEQIRDDLPESLAK